LCFPLGSAWNAELPLWDENRANACEGEAEE